MKKERLKQTTQRIIRDYYEQPYANKMHNLQEMDRFLEMFNLLRLSQKEIETMNKPIARTAIQTAIKNLSKTEKPRPDGFTGEFYQTFREELINPYPSGTLSKNSRGSNTSKFILQSHYHPDTKTRQWHHKKRKLQANITNEYRCKNPQQNPSKETSTIH